ncbi:MAG: membrane protein insertion efficiency factor YidD [Frankiaceae bacterium]|nr:membrane protein insertion efficiency factor YidD [Frankiaceae bacterium]
MGTSPLSALTIAAIHRYRRSDLAARSSGCCRFSPSCSHYAEQALRRRAYPAALMLIAWRLLRCRPRVPMGTWDPVPARRPHVRRRWSAVFLLSGIVTLGTIGMAQAVTPLELVPTATRGGCAASINSVDISAFNRNKPLLVKKGQRVVVNGVAPREFLSAPDLPGASTAAFIDVELISPFSKSTTPKVTDGYRQFQSVTNVDDYLKYGSGLYRVTVHATGTANGTQRWACSATFYAKLSGDGRAAFVAGLLGALGLGAAATASGKTDWAVGDEIPPLQEGPDVSQLTKETANAVAAEITPDGQANREANREAMLGCLVVLALFAFGRGETTSRIFGSAAFALRGSKRQPDGRRFWRRGHTVRGFLGGVLAGLGLTLFLQQRGYVYLTWQNTIVFPLLLGLIAGWRGWRGKAFIIPTAPREDPEPAT